MQICYCFASSMCELRFIDCFAGYPGSVEDLRIFRNNDLWHAVHRFLWTACHKSLFLNRNDFFPDQEFIIGDKAYPVLGWCLPPYRDNSHLTRIQKNFNQHLSKNRQLIERVISLLKGRFRRLKYLHMNRVDLIPEIILASCVLHNIYLDGVDDDTEDYILNNEVENNEMDIEDNIGELNAEENIEGINKRDYIAQTLPMLN